MSSIMTTVPAQCLADLKANYDSFETEGAMLCQVEEPVQRMSVEVEHLRCTRCDYKTQDREQIVQHLVECHEGRKSLDIYKKYNLCSRTIQHLQKEAQSIQHKHVIVPIKGLPDQVLRVPYESRLAYIFAAGAILRDTPGGNLSSPLLLETVEAQPNLYIDYNNLCRQSLLVSNLTQPSH